MDNKSWFDYINKKSFPDKLIELILSVERMEHEMNEGARTGVSKEDREYHNSEYNTQKERVNMMLEPLIKEHEVLTSQKEVVNA